MPVPHPTTSPTDSRVQVDLPCTVILASGVQVPGVARNLALAGMFVETRYPLSAMGYLMVQFAIPVRGENKTIELACRIESHATQISLGEFGIGLQFIDLDTPAREWLTEYMQTRNQLH